MEDDVKQLLEDIRHELVSLDGWYAFDKINKNLVYADVNERVRLIHDSEDIIRLDCDELISRIDVVLDNKRFERVVDINYGDGFVIRDNKDNKIYKSVYDYQQIEFVGLMNELNDRICELEDWIEEVTCKYREQKGIDLENDLD